MTRRQTLRLFAYGFVGILFVFLLILYSLYLSAQRPPEFYRDSLEVAPEVLAVRNDEMLKKSRQLNNAVQQTEKPWESSFSDDELNGYFAVETAKPGSNILPKDVHDVRLKIAADQLEIACRVEQGPLAGIVHLTLGVELPEPNKIKIRIKNAKLGRLPISRELAAKTVVEALEKQKRPVTQGMEAGDPTLTIPFELNYGKDKSIKLEDFRLENGTLKFSGATEKIEKKKPQDDR